MSISLHSFFVVVAVFLLPLFFTDVASHAQTEGLPVIRNYLPAEYKAGPATWGICQDDQGVIYFANDDGVLEFDGVTWRLIPLLNHVSARWVINKHGKIFVAAQGDCGYLDTGGSGEMMYKSLISDSLRAAWKLGEVWECDTASGSVFFRSTDLLIRWNGHALKTWPLPPGGERFDMITSVRDTLYFRISNLGLFRVDGDFLRKMENSEAVSEKKINAILPHSHGILLATRYEGLYLYQNSNMSRFPTDCDDLLRKSGVYHGIRLHDGKLVLATMHGGLVFLDAAGKLHRIIDRSTGLKDQNNHFVYEDRNRQLWSGMNYGISRIESLASLRIYDERSGLLGYIRSIQRHQGILYVATTTGLYKMNPSAYGYEQAFTKVIRDNMLIESITCRGNHLFIGANSGVYLYEQDRITKLHHGNTNYIYSLPSDPDIVLAGLHKGIAVIRTRSSSGPWEFKGHMNGIDEFVSSMIEASDHSVWVATPYQGIIRLVFRDDTRLTPVIERFNHQHGLPPGPVDMHESKGQILFSVMDRILMFDESRRTFTDYPGWKDSLGTMTEDDRKFFFKNFYLLGRFLNSPDYGRMEKTLRTIGQIQPNQKLEFFGDINRDWWFGGNYQLFMNTSAERGIQDIRAPLAIRRISVDQKDIFLGHGRYPRTDLNYGQSLKIDFLVPDYNLYNRPHYALMLEGLDDRWTERHDQTYIEYMSLHEGDYRLRIRAMNPDGAILSEIEYVFSVSPPWYRGTAAWLIYAACLAVGITFIFRWRLAMLKRRNIVLQTMVDERTRELRQAESQLIQSEKMAAIGQMVAGIAHEINNPLNFIIPNLDYIQTELNKMNKGAEKNSSGLAAPLTVPAQETGTEIQDAIRASIEGSLRIKDIVVRLKSFTAHGASHYDIVDIEKHFELMLDLFFHQFSEITIEKKFGGIPPVKVIIQEMNQCFMNILFNSVQAIQDARREKMIGTGAGRIIISTRMNGTAIEIGISDNGIGIQEEILTKIFDPFFTTKPVGRGKGLGLTESFAVIKKHHGEIKVESKHKEGTTVRITLPLL